MGRHPSPANVTAKWLVEGYQSQTLDFILEAELLAFEIGDPDRISGGVLQFFVKFVFQFFVTVGELCDMGFDCHKPCLHSVADNQNMLDLLKSAVSRIQRPR